MQQIKVTKLNGDRVSLDYDKINKMAEYACAGLADTSPSELAMKANLTFYDGITTTEIQTALVDAAHDLMSELSPNYQYAASRLFLVLFRKEVFGRWTPPTLYDHISKCVKDGLYDPELLTKFTKEEIDTIDTFIDHDRDFLLAYGGMRLMYDKYVIQNRVSRVRIETPQLRYMVMSMGMYANDVLSKRNELIKEQYDQVSTFEVSYPTPIQAGVGGTIKQYASCTGIQSGDSLESINASSSAIIKYVSKRSGIGLDVSRIRGIGSEIGDGSVRHTGIIPFMKHFDSAVRSCQQGGLRKGAATIFYPIWHIEVESLLVLKNNKGTDETRIRQSDYGVKLSRLFYKRFLSNEDITLFSPHEHEEMFDAFHSDQELFEKLYIEAESNPLVMKKTINARKLFKSIMDERTSTGRIYIANVDTMNTNTPFDPKHATIYQSNLCLVGDTKVNIKVGNTFSDVTMVELNKMIALGTEVYVLSYNINTKENEYKKVIISAMTGTGKSVISVREGGSNLSIQCTPEHRIWTVQRGYVEAHLLHGSDLVKLSNDTQSTTFVSDVNGFYDVFDITVEDNHNFYANGILVHNCLEIALPSSPIHNIEEGYNKKLIEVLDSNVFEASLNEYGFLPRSKLGVAYELVDMDNVDTNSGKEYQFVNTQDEEHGEIFLCILGAINVGKIESDEQLQKVCHTTVRTLDNLITDQDYPVKVAEISAKLRRTLGIGIINLAYYVAKNGMKYSDGSANKLVHELMEKIQFYLIEASALLAKERGVCDYYDQTSYSKGIMPIDRYNKNVDSLGEFEYTMDWDYLRNLVKENGMRHSTLSTQFPAENSAKVSNSTNGIEQPRSLMSIKDGVKFIVPEVEKYFGFYETMWESKTNKGYIDIIAIMQKFMDQSISTNTHYDPFAYKDDKIPAKVIMDDILYAYKMGVKTLYYNITNDSADITEEAGSDDCCVV